MTFVDRRKRIGGSRIVKSGAGVRPPLPDMQITGPSSASLQGGRIFLPAASPDSAFVATFNANLFLPAAVPAGRTMSFEVWIYFFNDTAIDPSTDLTTGRVYQTQTAFGLNHMPVGTNIPISFVATTPDPTSLSAYPTLTTIDSVFVYVLISDPILFGPSMTVDISAMQLNIIELKRSFGTLGDIFGALGPFF
jgi:hypothetical protein